MLIGFFERGEDIMNGPFRLAVIQPLSDEAFDIGATNGIQATVSQCRNEMMLYDYAITRSCGGLTVSVGVHAEPFGKVFPHSWNRAVLSSKREGFAALFRPFQASG